MVSYWILAASVVGGMVVAAGMIALALWVASLVRRAALGGSASSTPVGPYAPSSGVDAEVLRGLSERISILEGRLPALQQTLDGYAAISSRIADLEGRLPNVADAYDRFSQITQNADKRKAERERRANAKAEEDEGLTVEQAAGLMGLSEQAAKEGEVPKGSNARPPGVLGQGGAGARP